MSGIGVPQSKRIAPVATVSDVVTIDGTTSTAITKGSTAIAGCLVHSLIIDSFDDILDEAKVMVYDDSTLVASVMLVHTANQPLQGIINFPAPLPISTALKLKHSGDSDIDWRVLYTPY